MWSWPESNWLLLTLNYDSHLLTDRCGTEAIVCFATVASCLISPDILDAVHLVLCQHFTSTSSPPENNRKSFYFAMNPSNAEEGRLYLGFFYLCNRIVEFILPDWRNWWTSQNITLQIQWITLLHHHNFTGTRLYLWYHCKREDIQCPVHSRIMCIGW